MAIASAAPPQTLSSRDEELLILRAEKLKAENKLRQLYRNTKTFLAKAHSEERILPETLALLCETSDGAFELAGAVPQEASKRPSNRSVVHGGGALDSQNVSQNQDSDSLTQLDPALSQLSNTTASQGRREPFKVIPETPYKPSRKRGREDSSVDDDTGEELRRNACGLSTSSSDRRKRV